MSEPKPASEDASSNDEPRPAAPAVEPSEAERWSAHLLSTATAARAAKRPLSREERLEIGRKHGLAEAAFDRASARADAQLEAAKLALEAREWGVAQGALLTALEAEPERLETLELLALCHLERARTGGASAADRRYAALHAHAVLQRAPASAAAKAVLAGISELDAAPSRLRRRFGLVVAGLTGLTTIGGLGALAAERPLGATALVLAAALPFLVWFAALRTDTNRLLAERDATKGVPSPERVSGTRAALTFLLPLIGQLTPLLYFIECWDAWLGKRGGRYSFRELVLVWWAGWHGYVLMWLFGAPLSWLVPAYLASGAALVALVLDLSLAHDR